MKLITLLLALATTGLLANAEMIETGARRHVAEILYTGSELDGYSANQSFHEFLKNGGRWIADRETVRDIIAWAKDDSLRHISPPRRTLLIDSELGMRVSLGHNTSYLTVEFVIPALSGQSLSAVGRELSKRADQLILDMGLTQVYKTEPGAMAQGIIPLTSQVQLFVANALTRTDLTRGDRLHRALMTLRGLHDRARTIPLANSSCTGLVENH